MSGLSQIKKGRKRLNKKFKKNHFIFIFRIKNYELYSS